MLHQPFRVAEALHWRMYLVVWMSAFQQVSDVFQIHQILINYWFLFVDPHSAHQDTGRNISRVSWVDVWLVSKLLGGDRIIFQFFTKTTTCQMTDWLKDTREFRNKRRVTQLSLVSIPSVRNDNHHGDRSTSEKQASWSLELVSQSLLWLRIYFNPFFDFVCDMKRFPNL